MRTHLSNDAVIVDGRPMIVDIVNDGVPERPARIRIDTIDGSGSGASTEISLGRARRLFSERIAGRVAVAQLGELLAIVAQGGPDQFVLLIVDVRRARIAYSGRLPTPALPRNPVTHWRQVSIASSPDRLGIAVPHGGRLIWLEVDSNGRMIGEVQVGSGFGYVPPSVAWTGSEFAILTTRAAHDGYRFIDVPEVGSFD
ncbi:MAG: hypothetical protein H5U40_06010, partial [Polyangiaceae bacterium]|nr:hypothetical protein [Polyangiaceae bacterium]